MALSPLHSIFETEQVKAGDIIKVTKYSIASLKNHMVLLLGDLDLASTIRGQEKIGDPVNVETLFPASVPQDGAPKPAKGPEQQRVPSQAPSAYQPPSYPPAPQQQPNYQAQQYQPPQHPPVPQPMQPYQSAPMQQYQQPQAQQQSHVQQQQPHMQYQQPHMQQPHMQQQSHTQQPHMQQHYAAPGAPQAQANSFSPYNGRPGGMTSYAPPSSSSNQAPAQAGFAPPPPGPIQQTLYKQNGGQYQVGAQKAPNRQGDPANNGMMAATGPGDAENYTPIENLSPYQNSYMRPAAGCLLIGL